MVGAVTGRSVARSVGMYLDTRVGADRGLRKAVENVTLVRLCPNGSRPIVRLLACRLALTDLLVGRHCPTPPPWSDQQWAIQGSLVQSGNESYQ